MRHRLAKYIEEVLIQHECVTLPSIGGFIVEHCPAEWDRVRNISYAPRVVIRFNEALSHHDGILIEQYALHLGISLRRAKLELESDIKALRQELVRTHSYRLEGVGILSIESNGLMMFTPNPSPLIMHAYYGLSTAIAPQVSKIAKSDNTAHINQRASEYIQINLPRKAVHYSAAVAILAIVVGLPLAVWKPSTHSFQASFVPNKKAVSEIAHSIKEEVKQMQPQSLVQKERPQELPKAEPNQLVEAERGKYYLIIGTEKSESNAKGYLKLYGERFPNIQILTSKKLYRISADVFSSQSEAYTKQQELSKAGVSSWVYIP